MSFDTSFLIALGNGDRGALEIGTTVGYNYVKMFHTPGCRNASRDNSRQYKQPTTSGEVQWLPAPAVGEPECGVETAGTDEENRRVQNVCRPYPVVEIDAETVRRVGRRPANADRDAGGPGEAGVDDVDAMAAAVSEHLGGPVPTDSVRDFEALGVATETF